MKKALLGLVVGSTIAAVWWTGRSHDAQPTTDDDNLVVNRIWIDHIPRSDRDVFQIFVAITEQPVGVFQATSQWKGSFEFFQHETHKGELRVFYGQTGEREKIKAQATKCSEKGMDYCLKLDGASRGVKKYYSMEGWEIDGVKTPDELRHRIEMMLPKAGE